jgi:hypothetical protein
MKLRPLVPQKSGDTIRFSLSDARSLLGEVLFILLWPLLTVIGIIVLICFWLYLVVWCRWDGEE